MDEKELKQDGSRSEGVIDDFSGKLHADLKESGYEGKELDEAFAREKASFVSAVNEFKEEVRRRESHQQFEEMQQDEKHS